LSATVRTVAILPVKRFEQAKQRLSVPARSSLAATMAGEVMNALAEARSLDRVLVVTDDEIAAGGAARLGFEVVPEPSLDGHVAAALLGIERAVVLGARRVLLVPGDCPLLSGADVDALLGRHDGPGVVVVPDRHGTGTNALLLEPPGAIRPAFGPGSRERHERLAAAAGVRCTVDDVPALAYDVDTADDYAALLERS
jgi:2-phospho-L-lactate/phosphoenolpyruvate guanylyltransferase